MLFNTSILAPLIEEITFRKAFRDIIDTKWLFIIISGVVLGGLHVITSIRNAYDFLYLLPYKIITNKSKISENKLKITIFFLFIGVFTPFLC